MEQFKDVNRRKSKPKEKLNIAMFGQKRIPSREGGVEIVVEELCTRMVAQGHNVTCYNRGGHHVSGSEYDSKRLEMLAAKLAGCKLRVAHSHNSRCLHKKAHNMLKPLFNDQVVFLISDDSESTEMLVESLGKLGIVYKSILVKTKKALLCESSMKEVFRNVRIAEKIEDIL